MKVKELRRLLRETKEAATELVNSFNEMTNNTEPKKERRILEKLKIALANYKTKQASCEKNGLKVKISIEPESIKIKITNPTFEVQLTEIDLKMLKGMKISIE
jgi:hypothetical protein